MQTLSEFLKSKKNQDNVLNMVILKLGERGEWGTRGLFAQIGDSTGFSPAYVGQVLTGKKALTDNFLIKISEYLGVTISHLKEELSHTEAQERLEDVLNMIILKLRERGEWGTRGLFAQIGDYTGFSPAYVGQVLTGKKALTDNFLNKISEYLGVTISHLKEELSHTEAQERLEDVMDLVRGGFEGQLFKLVQAEPDFSKTRWTANSPYVFFKLLQELANYSYSLSPGYPRDKVKEMVTNKGFDLVVQLATSPPEKIEI